MLSLMCTAFSRESPTTRSNSSSTPSSPPTISYPPSDTWQVSRHTPSRSPQAARSNILRSSSNRPPISLPFPAMVSRSTVVFSSELITWSSMAAIWRQPSSTPWPTWLPGWKL